MMNYDEKKTEIEEKWKPCAEACNNLMKALNEFRGIKLDDVDENDTEEMKTAMALGREIDNRAVYILRSLLVQHGNILFL